MTITADPDAALLGAAVSGTVKAAGVDVQYYDSLEETPGRAPIVLVHGTGGTTARHFRFLFPMLATAQRVVAVDLNTDTTAPADMGPHAYADQVASAIEEILPDRRVSLAGYSLGAVVAATVAARRADLVDRLVLMAGWLKTTAGQALRNQVWLDLHRSGQQDTLARYFAFCAFSDPFLNWRTRAELDALIASVASDDATRHQMEMNRTVDLTEVAPTIACPTLIIAGTDDQMTPRRQSKALFGAIPDARYTEVTSGHAMVAERPAELVHLLTNFNGSPDRYPAGEIIPSRMP
ncbi:alpha/beta hydrolase [Nocardioides sp. CER19]|uniref:alpha/beta fold hydrolase n=1 Tax=Nocardioides sp. CER19 TaxID=3038538 RepID=UPI00244C232C|nr:alpha/beta hydrolase [Nocardioides sp. CER19]MDH2416154.1 alpha/beta hydrolase [Nocardioides sp. CER19]